MADLETAASETVERVQRLTAELDLANEALDHAETDSERLRGEVTSAVEDLDRAAQELSTRTTAEADAMTAEGEETKNQVSALTAEVNTGAEALQGARSALVGAFASAQQTVAAADAEHEQALGQLAAIVDSLRQRADELEAKLVETAAEVESFLGQEMPQAFDEAEARVNEARAQAEHAADQAVAKIQAEGQEFAEAVGTLKSEIEEAFDQAPETVTAAVSEATAAYLDAQRTMLASLAQKAEWIVETLEATERAATENDLDDIAEQSQADAQAVLDGLKQIIALYRASTEHCAQYELEGAQQALSQLSI